MCRNREVIAWKLQLAFSELNLECQVKACEKRGIGIAKRLALVRADIWRKRKQARRNLRIASTAAFHRSQGANPLTGSSDELGAAGDVLENHKADLNFHVCGRYRAERQQAFG